MIFDPRRLQHRAHDERLGRLRVFQAIAAWDEGDGNLGDVKLLRDVAAEHLVGVGSICSEHVRSGHGAEGGNPGQRAKGDGREQDEARSQVPLHGTVSNGH